MAESESRIWCGSWIDTSNVAGSVFLAGKSTLRNIMCDWNECVQYGLLLLIFVVIFSPFVLQCFCNQSSSSVVHFRMLCEIPIHLTHSKPCVFDETSIYSVMQTLKEFRTRCFGTTQLKPNLRILEAPVTKREAVRCPRWNGRGTSVAMLRSCHGPHAGSNY